MHFVHDEIQFELHEFDNLMSHLNAEDNDMAAEVRAKLEKLLSDFKAYRAEFDDMSGESEPSVDLYQEGIKAAKLQAEYGDGQ